MTLIVMKTLERVYKNYYFIIRGVDADLLMKVLGNPEMAALLTSLAKSLKAE